MLWFFYSYNYAKFVLLWLLARIVNPRYQGKLATFVKAFLAKAKTVLDKVLDFIDLLLSKLKKGAKHLFDEFSKIVDEIFGAGKKVEDLPKTAAEERVLAKKEAQAKRLEEKKKRSSKKSREKNTRKASQEDIDKLAKVREFFSAGKKKNVAFTKGKIDGEKIELWSRSGGEKGQNFDNFKPIDPENYHYKGPISDYIHHTEQKQIEYLYQLFKDNKNVTGKIEIVSDLKICRNCKSIIEQFKKDFPNIEVTTIWVNEILD